MIYVYGDDGADENRERVVAVSAVAGLEEWWRDLESRWIPRCKGIPFHAKDCESDYQDYRGIPHEENKAMYRELTQIAADSSVSGIAVAIDLTAQQKVFPGSLQISYYRAFVEVIARVADMAESVGHIAKLTFDVSGETEYNAGLLYSQIQGSEPRLIEWLDPEISFVSAKKSPRVQVGDLLAYEAWKALDHTVGPIKRKRKSWDALRSTGRFETYSYSHDWFGDLAKNIESGEVAKRANFTQQDYFDWLTSVGRQHNLSNLFTFLGKYERRKE